jgi:hypothetical protein
MKPTPKKLRIKKAIDLLRQPGHRLMLMHNNTSPDGRSYFVVPGGYVEPKDALKIITREDVHAYNEGLFPDCIQSWRLGPK